MEWKNVINNEHKVALKEVSMEKNRIINWVFGIIFSLTTVFFIVLYIMVCQDMMHGEGAEDILVKLPSAFMWIFFLLIGIPVYLVELDLFHNVKYFVKEKEQRRWVKTVINVISTLVSLKILSDVFLLFIQLDNVNEGITSIWRLCFKNYIVLRVVYLLIHLIYVVLGRMEISKQQ